MLDWIDIRVQRPALGRVVLVRSFSGRMNVMILHEGHGTMSGTGEEVLHYSFYPGGLPIENVTHWAVVYGPDGREPRL